MNKNLYSGKLIAIDGPNGAGKTTIIQELKKELEKQGIDTCFTKEPIENELGCFVRKYAEKCDGISVACLVAADRYQHLKDEIVPQLEKGKIVITDRYVLSSLILQRMDGVSEEFILAINNEIVQPDLQIAVFADSDVIQNRLKERSCLTRFEKGNKTNIELEYMERGIQVLQEQGIDVFRLINDNNLRESVKHEIQICVISKNQKSNQEATEETGRGGIYLKSHLKRVLEEAFSAPEPKRKEEFLKKTGQPRISTFSFLLSQISYIRKRVWFVSVLIAALAITSIHHVGQDCIWVISAMMPFIALCAVTENARSAIYSMSELEMASRFSLKSVTLARLSAIGLLHVIIFCTLIPFVRKNALLPFVQVGIYLIVPYLLTSVLGLVAVRKVHGKETIYICMGISVMVSFLNLILKQILPGIYEKKQFIWWCIFVICLFAKAWNEYKKAIYQTEEMVWN